MAIKVRKQSGAFNPLRLLGKKQKYRFTIYFHFKLWYNDRIRDPNKISRSLTRNCPTRGREGEYFDNQSK